MCNIIRTVVIDLMNHGERNGDYTTARGFDQVAASVRKHLHGVDLDAAYHSERNSAREAAVHVLEILDGSRVMIARHEAFFVDALLEGNLLADLVVALAAIGTAGTMTELIQRWNVGRAARGQVQGGLMNIAGELAMLDPDEHNYHALVGYHGPLVGIAATDTDTMPARFDCADIVRYTLTNDGRGWVIASSVHLRCPLVSLRS